MYVWIFEELALKKLVEQLLGGAISLDPPWPSEQQREEEVYRLAVVHFEDGNYSDKNQLPAGLGIGVDLLVPYSRMTRPERQWLFFRLQVYDITTDM